MAVSPSSSSWMCLVLVACAGFMLSPRGLSAQSPLILSGAPRFVAELDEPEVEFHAANELVKLERLLQPGVGISVPVVFHAPAIQERLTVWLPTRADDVSDDLLEHMKTFLRCQRTGRRHTIDRRLIAAMGKVAEQFPGKEIEVVSGYRVGHGVKKSKHFRGRAIDFRVVGVPAHVVRDAVWKTFDDHVGVGSYRGRSFIHLDIRPHEPKIGWTQRRVGARYRYNPWWTAARRISGS